MLALGAAARDVVSVGDDAVLREEGGQVQAALDNLHEKHVLFGERSDAHAAPASALQRLQNEWLVVRVA